MGNFQSVLKSLRTANNLTQDELAKALKCSRSAIGMYEKGSREPDYETLETIADYFNVDIDYLLGRTTKTTMIPCSPKYPKIMDYYNQLNDIGKHEATKRVEELTNLPKYINEPDRFMVNAAHAIPDSSEEDKQHDEDIMDDENF